MTGKPQWHKDTENYPEKKLTGKIIQAAIEVYKGLGPSLLESAYEKCFEYEMNLQGINFQSQVKFPIIYKSIKLEPGYVIDMVVEKRVILEFKAVVSLLPVHEAQLLTYLKLTGIRVGLLINFNVPVLKDGIKRMVL